MVIDHSIFTARGSTGQSFRFRNDSSMERTLWWLFWGWTSEIVWHCADNSEKILRVDNSSPDNSLPNNCSPDNSLRRKFFAWQFIAGQLCDGKIVQAKNCPREELSQRRIVLPKTFVKVARKLSILSTNTFQSQLFICFDNSI